MNEHAIPPPYTPTSPRCMSYTYRSTLNPDWLDVEDLFANIPGVSVAVIEQTDDRYTIRADAPLSGRLCALHELDKLTMTQPPPISTTLLRRLLSSYTSRKLTLNR